MIFNTFSHLTAGDRDIYFPASPVTCNHANATSTKRNHFNNQHGGQRRFSFLMFVIMCRHFVLFFYPFTKVRLQAFEYYLLFFTESFSLALTILHVLPRVIQALILTVLNTLPLDPIHSHVRVLRTLEHCSSQSVQFFYSGSGCMFWSCIQSMCIVVWDLLVLKQG